jgi:predicted permease
VSGLPLEAALNLNVDVLDGAVDEQVSNALTDWRYATAGYFDTLGIPIVAGRGFTNADRAGAPPVAVVSETFARRILKGRALGRHIRIFDADGSMEVVGIVADLREGGLRGPVPAVMYVPVAQTHATALKTTHSYFHVSWVVRTAGINARLARQIELEVGALDPRQPMSAFRTMDEVKSRAMAAERFQMILLGCFAGIGLLLASAGIYGLVAYTVAQRTREFGIRMALGASKGRILGAVLRQSALLTLAGVVVGGAASILATRALRSFVWGVSTTDAATFAIVLVLLALVAIAASLVPAVRAVRLNPIRALRE